ncbi:hypothetical protein ACU60T_23895 [Klebsiella aerogenes]
MEGISLTDLIILAVLFSVNLIPAIRISRKMGYGWSIAISMLIPGLSYALFWCLAFFKWPNEKLLKHIKDGEK